MKNIFYVSKLLVKKKLDVLTDLEASKLDKFNEDYPFIEGINFEKLIDKTDDHTTINNEKAWKKIEVKFNRKQNKSFFQLSYKYVAAAVVILGAVTSAYFFANGNLNTSVTSDSQTIENNIKTGTNKAILTLEDGSFVALEKGTTYQNHNVNSNGEQIVYDAKEQNTTRVIYNYLTIPRGGQFFIKLSDGTNIWLNSETQLKYPVTFTAGKTRQVELVYGEAYFVVSPSSKHDGAPFKVKNKHQDIKVLGTEFNVKAYKNETNIYTTLAEGKVSINTQTINQLLKPTEQARINIEDNTITINTVNVYNEISWKDGVFSFRRKPLKEIMKVLSRWYDIEFHFENQQLEKEGFNGVIDKNQDIEDILKTIKNFGVIKDYEINNKTILLK